MASLQGLRVVVLGGTSGIGFATARAASEAGASVVVVSSHSTSVEEALEALPEGTAGMICDLSVAADVKDLFDRIGDFDHLVFTAGDALLQGPLAEVDFDEARQFLQLRFWGAFSAAKYAAPKLRTGGSIVLTSGSVGERPPKGVTVVASGCGAIEALTRALAVELAPLRVNIVRPSIVETDLWISVAGEDAEETLNVLGRKSLIGRPASAAELADAYIFAMTATYVTGRVIAVDGGAALV